MISRWVSTNSVDRVFLSIVNPSRSASFWNYRETCELVDARYPAAPLGLCTVAALLPPDWEVTLVDRNVAHFPKHRTARISARVQEMKRMTGVDRLYSGIRVRVTKRLMANRKVSNRD